LPHRADRLGSFCAAIGEIHLHFRAEPRHKNAIAAQYGEAVRRRYPLRGEESNA
jgi:hypothetical protein